MGLRRQHDGGAGGGRGRRGWSRSTALALAPGTAEPLGALAPPTPVVATVTEFGTKIFKLPHVPVAVSGEAGATTATGPGVLNVHSPYFIVLVQAIRVQIDEVL